MKKNFWVIYGIIGLVSLGFILYVSIINLPGKNISWEKTNEASSSGLKGVIDFFKETFSSKEMNVLVIGKPGISNDQTYHGSELADAIMLVHFDPDKKKVFLISIPRDLWIDDDGQQYKINEIVHKKRIEVGLSKIEEITGIKPMGYVIVDLKTLESLVDDMGGVDVTLNEPAVDWVSGYTLGVGAHHLNGEDAIWLVRNRYNPSGDFFREHNQYSILQNLFNKFKSLDRDKKLSLIKKYVIDGNLLETADVSYVDLASYLFGGDFENIKLESIVLDFSTKLLKTSSLPLVSQATTTYVSVLVPSSGFENYQQIKEYIKKIIDKP